MTASTNYANAAKEPLLTKDGVAQAVAEKRAEQWVAENAKAFDCWNVYIEKNGLPLAKYRMF